jgi:hypothetical protein
MANEMLSAARDDGRDARGVAQTDARANLHAQVTALLDDRARERGALLRALSALAGESAFEACAEVWAPALYARDAAFFETFLLRRLSGRQAEVIGRLLPLAEADGHDALFTGLYAKVAQPEAWNAELLALAGSPAPDEVVARAVARRRVSALWFALTPEAALALYQRTPALFREFVGEYVRGGGADSAARDYTALLEAVRRQGDDALYWRLFRQTAGAAEWERAVKDLLRDPPPADGVLAAVRERQPERAGELDAGVMAELLERYGAAVLPYVEQNVTWVGRRGIPKLLEAARKLGDEGLYWRVFFRVGNASQWNKELRELAGQTMTEEAMGTALRLRTPPTQYLGRWHVEPAVGTALYRRALRAAVPFLGQWLNRIEGELFTEAERQNDEAFLDTLTALLIRQMAWLVYSIFPTPSEEEWKKPDPRAQSQLTALGELVVAQLARLHAQSPETYVRHAANILSQFDTFDGWSFKRNVEANPAFAYLYSQHRADWLKVPEALRDLVESPNTAVQVVGLEILAKHGAEAPSTVAGLLVPLRAILLGTEGINLKKRALLVLERAARADADAAREIEPLLAEALHFQAECAIDERILVSYVRLRETRSLAGG